MRNHYTSNMAEGMFAKIKDWLDHKISPMVDILDCFVRESKMLIKRNIKSKIQEIPFELYEGKQLGNFASNEIIKTYKKMQKIIQRNVSENDSSLVNCAPNIAKELGNCDCIIKNEYNLPCIHDLFARYMERIVPLLNEDDIPSIYYRCSLIEKTISPIHIEKPIEKKNISYSYQNIMDMIAPIASEAQNNPKIQELFKTLFQSFKDMQTNKNEGSFPNLPIPGRQITKQSKYVEHIRKQTGRPKEKRTYFCSICKMPGHNAARCTKRKKESE